MCVHKTILCILELTVQNILVAVDALCLCVCVCVCVRLCLCLYACVRLKVD